MVYPQNTNMQIQHGGLEDVFFFQMVVFQVPAVETPGGKKAAQPLSAGRWLKERRQLSECMNVLMSLMSSTCEHDWFILTCSICSMDVHGCANCWLSHWLVSTIFHCSSPAFFFFHPPLLRPNSRTFWPRRNTICWLIRQAIASHALIFISRRTDEPLSWLGSNLGSWLAKGKGHFGL